MPSARAEKPSEFFVYHTGACEKARGYCATKACGRARISALFGRQVAPEHRRMALIGERRLDHEARQLLDDVLECRPLTAPPGSDRRQRQDLAHEGPRGGRRKA